MAWTTPLTAVTNAALTAAQWNASVRDDLLETAPAKATGAGAYPVFSGANQVAQRQAGEPVVDTLDSTTSTAYVTTLDGATSGPSVTSTTGPRALNILTCDITNTTAGHSGRMSQAISGATTVAAADSRALRNTVSSAAVACNVRASLTSFLAITAGSNTFDAAYRASGGTAQFANRRMTVMPY